MAQPDDQNNSGLRVSGYGPRIRQAAIVVIVLVAIVAAIALAAIWSNRQEPEVGVQPTPRPTRISQPTPTPLPPDTPTPTPTEPAAVRAPDTATPTSTKTPVEDTPTSEPEKEPEPAKEPPTATPSPTATEAPATEVAPTPEPTEQPTATAVPSDTPVPPTQVPTVTPTATATSTPIPEPTAKPTVTPTPAPTATPTITPIPTPSVPTILEIKARGQLIDRGIGQSDIKVLNAEEHTWLDLTLGCGPIGGDNPARPVDGWILFLGNDEKTYRFHVASKEQEVQEDLNTKDDVIRDCTDVENPEQVTVNLVHDLRLHEARQMDFYRGLPENEQAVVEIKDLARIRAVLDTLNTNTPIGNDAICQTARRIDFHVLRGIQTIRFLCEKDWYRVGGSQEVWGDTQGALTQEFLNAVGPYFAGGAPPEIPKAEPEE